MNVQDFVFKKAVKEAIDLRLCLLGPPGAGKTYSSLGIAKHLGDRIAVIDTERGKAKLYAGEVAEFEKVELTNYSPTNYIKAIAAAAAAKFPVLIIDSLSHAWTGVGGILDQKDKISDAKQFYAWRDLTPQHNELIDAILDYPGHVIVTMRVKVKHVVETDSKGKTVIRKLGLEPVQRDGMEYEFDVVGDLDDRNILHITKSRCSKLPPGLDIRQPGADFANTLKTWLTSGEARAQPPPTERKPEQKTEQKKPEVDHDREEKERIKAARQAIAEQAKRLGIADISAATNDEEKKAAADLIAANIRVVSGGTMPSNSIEWEDALSVFKEMDPPTKTPAPTADAPADDTKAAA